MSKEKYIIEAYPYHRPETILRGVIEKGSGQTRTTDEPISVLNRRAEIGVPNWTESWGVRLDSDGKAPESPIDIKSTSYKGQIKLLPWGAAGGYLIVLRYLRGFQTLDQQYQDVVLGAKDLIREDNEASADGFYIRLQSGDNYYDPETDKYLVMMLRAHYMNESSPHRSPNSQSYMFRELKEADESVEVKAFDDKLLAMQIVKEAANDNSFAELRNLSVVAGDMVKQVLEDSMLFGYMKMLAEQQTSDFVLKINDWKKMVSDEFEKAKIFKILDLTKNGFIVARDGNEKVEIASEVPAKGDDMAVWMIEHFVEQKAFEGYHKLKSITDKIK